MKKFIKNNIIGFILGAVIFSSITVAAYSVLANDIRYTPKDSTWKKSNGEDITNVSEAIDELYNKAKILNKLTLKIRSESWSSTDAGVTNYNLNNISDILNNYKYLKITGVTTNNVKNYQIMGHNIQTNSNVTLTINKEYDLSQVDNFWIVVYSNTTGTNGYAIPTIEFYNK